MDSKKKKKVVISVVCITVILIAAIITGTVLGVRKMNADRNANQNANNMSTVTDTNTYNTAIAEGQIPANYNGIYKFKAVSQIDFSKELTKADIEKICINKTSKPYTNDLVNAMQDERAKIRDEYDEKLVFFNGLFNKNYKNNPGHEGSDHGTYVGNDDLSMVTTKNTTFFISLNYADINNNIPVADKQNKDKTKVYVIEKVYSKENPSRLLFNITYIYELIPEEIKTIPDSELDF